MTLTRLQHLHFQHENCSLYNCKGEKKIKPITIQRRLAAICVIHYFQKIFVFTFYQYHATRGRWAHQLTIQKRTAVVIMADVRYKTKDKSNILKKLSKKFITISMKKSFHRIQVDIISDRSMLRRERNSIVVAKKKTSILHN